MEDNMATTRLIPLHVCKSKTIAKCLRDRANYAENSDKTREGELVSSYECAPQTCDKEFLLAKREYLKINGFEHKGNIIATFSIEQNEAMDEVSAYKTVQLMKGVVEYGTGVRLHYRYKLDMPMAGKTGTTDNNSDGWFMGYTPLLTAGVWVGCEDRAAHFRSTNLGQGANTALPVWALFMKKCYADPELKLEKTDFPKPENPDADLNFDCSKYETEEAPKASYNFE